MPISKEQEEQLAREAMEKEGLTPNPRAGPPRHDRLMAAASVLGQALEAVSRSNDVAKSALAMFMGEWSAVRQTDMLANPTPRQQEALREMQALTRPKTFNTDQPRQE